MLDSKARNFNPKRASRYWIQYPASSIQHPVSIHRKYLNNYLCAINQHTMSLLNQQNNKNKKKGNKKNNPASATGSKFIQKPGKAASGGFVSKQANTGSQRGS